MENFEIIGQYRTSHGIGTLLKTEMSFAGHEIYVLVTLDKRGMGSAKRLFRFGTRKQMLSMLKPYTTGIITVSVDEQLKAFMRNGK